MDPLAYLRSLAGIDGQDEPSFGMGGATDIEGLPSLASMSMPNTASVGSPMASAPPPSGLQGFLQKHPNLPQSLLQMGLATMAAGGRPGATLLGSVGEGGLVASQQYDRNRRLDAQEKRADRLEKMQEQSFGLRQKLLEQTAREKAAKDRAAALGLVPLNRRAEFATLIETSKVDPTDQGALLGLITKAGIPLAPKVEKLGENLVDMSDPSAPKVILGGKKLEKIREGDKEVTYEVGLDGTRTRVASGEAFAPDRSLVQVFDASSPTGARYVSRGEALGKEVRPESGLSITSDGKGGFAVTQGRGVGQGGLTQKTQGEIEGRQLDAGEQMGRLAAIQGRFKPEYQQLIPRAGQALNSMKDFMGAQLSPEATKSLTDFTQFRRDATANLNQTIKDLTGAAMGVQEAERIIATAPNAGSGIFDGDSPTQFKAKLDASIDATRNAMMRYSYAKNNGVDPLKTGIEIQDVPNLLKKRGDELAQKIWSENPQATPEAVKAAVKDAIRKEFGIR